MATADLTEAAMMDALTHLFAEDRKTEIVIDETKTVESSVEVIDAQASEIGAQVSVQPQDLSESGKELPAKLPEEEQSKPKVSRAELIQIMEGFVEMVKNSDDADFGNNPLSFAPPKIEIKDAVTIEDKTAEINELRTLLVEAQGTIIRLLTDRVDDRARLAQLQSEIKLLPDYKSQSERAAAVAITSEEFKAEFAKVKLEIERMKLTKMRGEGEGKARPWWARFTDWLKKKDTVGE
ncbi:MAG TPA: hypothetical protein V6C76_08625 [Drouetiella sp.]